MKSSVIVLVCMAALVIAPAAYAEASYIAKDGTVIYEKAKESAEMVDWFEDEDGVGWDFWVDYKEGFAWYEVSSDDDNLTLFAISGGQSRFRPTMIPVGAAVWNPSYEEWTYSAGEIVYSTSCGTYCHVWDVGDENPTTPQNVDEIYVLSKAIYTSNYCDCGSCDYDGFWDKASGGGAAEEDDCWRPYLSTYYYYEVDEDTNYDDYDFSNAEYFAKQTWYDPSVGETITYKYRWFFIIE